MNLLSWFTLSIIDARFFSKKKHENVLWVVKAITDDHQKPDVYLNVMRVASLMAINDPAWMPEAKWLIKTNKFGDVSKDEREYLLQYLDQQSAGAFENLCKFGTIDYDNVSKWAKKNFPLKEVQNPPARRGL